MTERERRAVAAVTMLLLLVGSIVGATVAISQSPQRLAEANLGSRVDPDSTSMSVGHTEVVVTGGDSAAVIARRLLERGVIDSQARFELLASLLGWEIRLEPGSYSFESGLTTYEILRRIHFGETSPLRVVLPEGLRVEQVIERLVAANVSDATSLRNALSTAPEWIDADSLAANRPAGTTLEGYLFPSAYSFPLGASAEEALALMLRRFDDSFTQDLRAQLATAERSLHEILTIASIIEREAAVDAERPLVSAVIWNRLDAGMRLQMDSTVYYAVGRSDRWWSGELTSADLALESPYNTYIADGLPPTPIASPGLASIEAALNPARAPYLFFFGRGDGTHLFAVTFEEHQANIERAREGLE